MRIERRYTKEGQSPYADIGFRLTTSEIRNPDGSIVFHADNVEVPEQWSQVASDVLAQKYFRKAGVPARLKKVEEETVPSWLWRSVADDAALDDAAREGALHRRDLVQAGVRPARRHLDLLGLEGRLFRHRSRRAGVLRRAPLHAGDADGGAELAAMVQHRPALGLWHRRPEPGPLLCRLQDRRSWCKSATAYEHPQPHACFIQSISDDLVNEGGIMDLWVREARLFKYGSGTGTNFSKLRGEGERLSGGGKSSGLMSFLKIGDRAAGAIKSGGTTRRAAKMVIVDVDHPDIEQFIDWKVAEEQKVASLVTGSKINQKHLRAIFKACVNCEGSGDDCFDPDKNPVLRREIKAARRNHVPDNYIQRIIQFAKQGYNDIDFPIYDTDWDSEAYLTVSGQNSNNSVRVDRRVPQGRRGRPRLGSDLAHQAGQDRQDREGARPVGEDRPRRLGQRRSRPAIPHHRQRLAHLPGLGSDHRLEPVLGVHVPRRHRLQSGVAEPAGVPHPDPPSRSQRRRAGVRASSTSRATSTRCGCGPWCSKSR